MLYEWSPYWPIGHHSGKESSHVLSLVSTLLELSTYLIAVTLAKLSGCFTCDVVLGFERRNC